MRRRATNLRSFFANRLFNDDVSLRDLQLQVSARYIDKINIKDSLSACIELESTGVCDHEHISIMTRLLEQCKETQPTSEERRIATRKLHSMTYFLLITILNERRTDQDPDAAMAAMRYVSDRVVFGADYSRDTRELRCYARSKRAQLAAEMLSLIRIRLFGDNECLYSPFATGGWYPLGLHYTIAMSRDIDEFVLQIVDEKNLVRIVDAKEGVDILQSDPVHLSNDEYGAVLKSYLHRMQGRRSYSDNGHGAEIHVYVPGEGVRQIDTIIYELR